MALPASGRVRTRLVPRTREDKVTSIADMRRQRAWACRLWNHANYFLAAIEAAAFMDF